MTAKNRPLKGIRHETSQAPRYFFPRVPTTTDKRDPSTNKPYEVGSFGIIGKNPINGIPVKTGTEGQYWYLSKFDSNGDAIWLPFSSGGAGPVIQLDIDANTAPGTDPVLPAGDGTFNLNGAVVAAHSVPIETHSRAANSTNIEIQVASTNTGAPLSKAKAGLAQFDDTAFVVDADGYVTLAGGAGPATDSFAIDNNTAPGTNPVVPTGAGQVTVNGAVVAAHSLPVDIHSRAANAFNVEVQVAATNTGAPLSKAKAGLAQFDDTQFVVDADGYTTLVGGGGLPPAQTLTGNDSEVVGPDGSGNIDIQGVAVANATFTDKPLYFDGTPGSNLIEAKIQVAKDITGAPSDKYDAGICSFDDTKFTVTEHGYVSLATGIGNGALVYLTQATANASSSIEFDNTYITSNYDTYYILIELVAPATDADRLVVKFSNDNGSTFETSNYVSSAFNGKFENSDESSTSQMNLSQNSFGNDTAEVGSLHVYLTNLPNSGSYSYAFANGNYIRNGSAANFLGGGLYSVQETIDAIQFSMESGNIASGTFKLYGIEDS